MTATDFFTATLSNKNMITKIRQTSIIDKHQHTHFFTFKTVLV